MVFGMLVPLFGTPSLLILDLSTLTLPSNPISKLTCCVLRAFLAPNNSIHALLIRISMSILALKFSYITKHSRPGISTQFTFSIRKRSGASTHSLSGTPTYFSTNIQHSRLHSLVSHLTPVNSETHWHENWLTPLIHVAPFWHGWLKHSSISEHVSKSRYIAHNYRSIYTKCAHGIRGARNRPMLDQWYVHWS
jgi:hypothetical protein